jgi:hypothetical protein
VSLIRARARIEKEEEARGSGFEEIPGEPLADAGGAGSVAVEQGGGIGQVEAAGEDGLLGGIFGEEVGGGTGGAEAEALAEEGEEGETGEEVADSVLGQQTEAAGGAQGVEGAGDAQLRVGGAVEELEALDQEFDVGEAAGAKLQVPRALLQPYALRLDAPLHRSQLGVERSFLNRMDRINRIRGIGSLVQIACFYPVDPVHPV